MISKRSYSCPSRATSPRQQLRKVATNLAHLYKIGRIGDLRTDRIDRWWVDALFLALDRLIEDQRLTGINVPETEYADLLRRSDFAVVSGKRSTEKELATKHLIRLVY